MITYKKQFLNLTRPKINMALLDSDVNVLKFIRNHQVTESLCKLYLNDDMADVHFVFGADTDNIQRLCAHRVILAAASPVFHQMFYGDLREAGDVIISDCSFEAFSEFFAVFLCERCVADQRSSI